MQVLGDASTWRNLARHCTHPRPAEIRDERGCELVHEGRLGLDHLTPFVLTEVTTGIMALKARFSAGVSTRCRWLWNIESVRTDFSFLSALGHWYLANRAARSATSFGAIW